MRWLGIGFVFAFSCIAAEHRLDTLLKAVETRYNRAQSLTLSFEETYIAQRHPRQVESGTLTLRKPGKMRWDYAKPAGKVFVSDGKRVSLYNPETNQVEVTGVKETEDMRAPLAFLLGKLNFYKEFRKFTLREDPEGIWIGAEPENETLPYSRVEFLVAPDARIKRLKVFAQDRSVLDFRFEQEKLNIPVDPKIFDYRVPITAQVLTEGEK